MTNDKVVIEQLLFILKPDFVTHYQFVLSGGFFTAFSRPTLRLHTFTKLHSLKYYIPRNCYFLLPGSTPGWKVIIKLMMKVMMKVVIKVMNKVMMNVMMKVMM